MGTISPMGTSRSSGRASALVRAEHGGRPMPLDSKQKAVLADAIREGTDLADELETKVGEY